MNVKNILTGITMVAIVILMVTLLVTAIMPRYHFHEKVYVVISGDCIWDIASRYCPKSMDRWEYIEKVCEANNLTTYTLQPGQVLTVFEVDE